METELCTMKVIENFSIFFFFPSTDKLNRPLDIVLVRSQRAKTRCEGIGSQKNKTVEKGACFFFFYRSLYKGCAIGWVVPHLQRKKKKSPKENSRLNF